MKTSVLGMIPPYELLAKKAPMVAIQYTKSSTGYYCCSCIPTNYFTLLVKMSHMVVIGHKEIVLELSWKLPP